MCPTIDAIDKNTLAQRRQGNRKSWGARAVFDWHFKYQLLPLLSTSHQKPSKPFEIPVMAGGLFAMHAKFFWELGAYDAGLESYGKRANDTTYDECISMINNSKMQAANSTK